jgi:hypothetical protein
MRPYFMRKKIFATNPAGGGGEAFPDTEKTVPKKKKRPRKERFNSRFIHL